MMKVRVVGIVQECVTSDTAIDAGRMGGSIVGLCICGKALGWYSRSCR